MGASLGGFFEADNKLGVEDPSVYLVYRQGVEYDLCALSITAQYFLTTIIRQSPYAAKLGTVWYYAQDAAYALRKALTKGDAVSEAGEDAYSHSPTYSYEEAVRQGIIAGDFNMGEMLHTGTLNRFR